MRATFTSREMLNTIKSGFQAIGYRDNLLYENYRFVDPVMSVASQVRNIDLAVFAQEPPSYRSACFGVALLDQKMPDDANSIRPYHALGAPQVFALHPDLGEIYRWRIVATGTPELIEQIEPGTLYDAIFHRRTEWSPEQILRAKSIGAKESIAQLDFFDIGLVPAIESIIQQKLDGLLRGVIASSKDLYAARHNHDPDYRQLFRLIFRLIAAKLLSDRQHPGENWNDPNPEVVIKAVENFYFRNLPTEPILQDEAVQQLVWDKIRTAFHFSNVSVETLAYVYENTLVSPEIRQTYDIHATPPEIAEYVVRQLPFEELPQGERRVFEPFSGHAPFLIAALGRLRMLLPPDMSQTQRHKYFVEMLSGLEIDSFAREVARDSLIFADYPNPDGWQIIEADAFTSPLFDKHLTQAQIVLCNPPYGDFSPDDRQVETIAATNKAVEALRRVLQYPPKMLGFVLPRVFVSGQQYREVRRKLTDLYRSFDVVSLPETTFQHSSIETVLLLAYGNKKEGFRFRSSAVDRKDYQQFTRTGQPTWQAEAPALHILDQENPIFWYEPLQRIWAELDHLSRLGDVAEIHRGIEYNLPFRDSEALLVSDTLKPGFAKGMINTQEGFEPYKALSNHYLNMDPELMRRSSHKYAWDKPKVIANAARISADRWVIAGAVDTEGLVCYQNFHGIWPTEVIPVEVIAAILNSPIANAFISQHRTSRHNQVRVIRQVPIPLLTPAQTHKIVNLVNEYRSFRQQWLDEPHRVGDFEPLCREIIRQIDAEILSAYDLPPRSERELLDFFNGYQRPGPVKFDHYYPPGFKPAIPWSVYISEDFQESTAQQTLNRLPVLNDPVISAMVEELEEV